MPQQKLNIVPVKLQSENKSDNKPLATNYFFL